MVNRDDLRTWIANRRAGAEREREELRRREGDVDVVRAALGLISVAGRILGWPAPVDPRDEREDELARQTWARLRKRLAARP